MDDARWERAALLGGPVFVLLQLLGGFAPGQPPAPDDPADEIIEYFQDRAGSIGVGSLAIVLGGVFLVFWAGSLWRAMARAEDGRPRLTVVALAGMVLAGAMAQASTAVSAAMALAADDLAADTARLGWALTGTLAACLYLGIVAMVGAVSLLIRRTGLVAGWMAWLGLATAVFSLLGAVGLASDDEVWFALALPAFLLWAVWLVVLSFQLRAKVPSDATAA